MYPYNTKEIPPCPCLYISLESLFGNRVSGIKAKLDTGAFKTTVPMDILKLLEIQPSRKMLVMDYNNSPSLRYTYFVRIIHPDFEYQSVEVIGVNRGAQMLIGRDIINRWRLFLDGPKEVFEFK